MKSCDGTVLGEYVVDDFVAEGAEEEQLQQMSEEVRTNSCEESHVDLRLQNNVKHTIDN
jgi:hypothetical protein